jgi:eukaryotic-like serine/threonine-protein kinase
MTRWHSLETIYNNALALQPGERAAFLDAACGDDRDLRREIESLLTYEHQAETYMETPALQQAAQSLAQEGAGVLVDRMLGRYQLLSLVGQGGMAEVYCGVDSRLNRLVAVKVLPVYMASDSERVRRFEQEARAVAALNHPRICTLHDVGNESGMHYLVFEYLEGEPLSKRLSEGALPLTEGVQYAIQIAEALAYAHEQGIIHLDLKPENVMLMRTGVKLVDFGIAELRYPDTTDSVSTPEGTNTAGSGGRAPGTLGYMAPEQLEGRETDARTDVFAFGAVLYEIFTSQPAFPRRAPNSASPASRLALNSPLPISKIDPAIPPALDSLVARCLEKDPSERWQSVSMVLSNLRDIRATL